MHFGKWWSFPTSKSQVRNKHSARVYVVAESRLSGLPTEKPKSTVANGPAVDKKSKNKGSSSEKGEDPADSFEVLAKFSGASLVGKK